MRLSILSTLIGTVLIASPALALNGDATIHACAKVVGGNIRIVPEGTACLPSEVPLKWAQTAPTLSCPADTTLFVGVCIENVARAAAILSDASDDCADEGRRLPSHGELRAFRDLPGITLTTAGEWTDDVADINEFSTFAYLVLSDTGSGVREAFDDSAYRCVAGPLFE